MEIEKNSETTSDCLQQQQYLRGRTLHYGVEFWYAERFKDYPFLPVLGRFLIKFSEAMNFKRCFAL